MQAAHEMSREHMQVSVKRQTDLADMSKTFNIYKEGDTLWYLNITRKEAICTNLQRSYTGPLLIQKNLSDQFIFYSFKIWKEG